MSDLALIWDGTSADLAIEANDLARDDGLQTAVLLSLYLDRRAEDGDVLPSGEADRRGWWGDSAPVVDGDRIGSRLWLLARAKQTQETLARAEEYTREALQWMLDDKVTDRIAVTASTPQEGVLGLEITLYRPTADPVTFRYNYTWTAQAGE